MLPSAWVASAASESGGTLITSHSRIKVGLAAFTGPVKGPAVACAKRQTACPAGRPFPALVLTAREPVASPDHGASCQPPAGALGLWCPAGMGTRRPQDTPNVLTSFRTSETFSDVTFRRAIKDAAFGGAGVQLPARGQGGPGAREGPAPKPSLNPESRCGDLSPARVAGPSHVFIRHPLSRVTREQVPCSSLAGRLGEGERAVRLVLPGL